MKTLGRTVAVLMALGLATGIAFGRPLFGEKYQEKFAKTEALAKDGKVIIGNVSGSIQIKSWAQDQVQIDAVKVCNVSSEAKAKENMALVTIEIKKEGNIVQIDTKYPEKSKNLNVSVNYVLTIPALASIKVRNVSGSVEAADIGGMFEGDNTSGKVTLARIGGGVDCRVISGGIEVSDVKGDVDLTTVSGGITASRIKGSIDAETTSGSIALTEIAEPKTVRVKVLSGKIIYDGQIAPGGKYSFESLSGSVGLTIPAAAGFELEAETFSGSINTDFAVTMQGKIDRKEIRGVVNNGGAALRIKAFSGSIDIRKK
jgi:DUF4097 and DUF4098 domain-containing protein YvlB